MSIPTLDASALAVDVFDNVCFYDNEEFHRVYTQKREEVLQLMTVREVYMQFTKLHPKDPEKGIMDLGMEIGTRKTTLFKYFKAFKSCVEDILHSDQSIALTSEKDVKIFKSTHVKMLPTSKEIFDTTMSKLNTKTSDRTRANDLALVLGSSGSGKTFFALSDLAREFLRDEKMQDKNASLHIYPSETGISFVQDNGQLNKDAAHQLVDWIKDAISIIAKNALNRNVYPLKMHLCIIFDEAGDLALRPWFESKEMLVALCRDAAEIAEKVAVVVAGTALTGKGLNSRDDAYVFRMQPWKAGDFVKILENMQTALSFVDQDDTYDAVANAVFAHTKIGALATNGRSAYFLSKAIESLSLQYKSVVWKRQLDAWTTTLVTRVVADYIESNGLRNLKAPQRRRVAASVFHALQECKKAPLVLPDFVALNNQEIAIAHSIVQYNLELGVHNEAILVEDQKFAITVTSALAIVLYAIAGIPTTLMPGWKAEEELAALYCIRQLILSSIKTFQNNTSAGLCTTERALAELNKSLEKIGLIALQRQVEAEFDGNGKICIPIVGPSTVLLNGDRSPFADVIAPYTLVQAKRKTSKQQSSVNMEEEMSKCRLLKKQKQSKLVLRGLIAMWQGQLLQLMSTDTTTTDGTTIQTKSDRNPQLSEAFPENLLCLATKDQCPYATIGPGDENIVFGKNSQSLPKLDPGTTPISFILSTNVDAIKLKLLGNDVIQINQDNVDSDLCIANEKFSNIVHKEAWERFLEERVQDGVKIKILLTQSV